ncbi:endonuclease IV [Longilinea arvoryzae]|uniref:Endonuclease IV n=1 Tax=Longilinea arvoryzae TaxID=360412 RepID=A0A0S7BAM5_9CHLR|nr:TIM barrel protein [Longilinea arvoryzae]GAP14719.1 endonuclease IV [Longilinea arvoryzae]
MADFRFGTVGSPASTPAKPGGSVGAIQRLAELKLSALELGWVQAVRVSEATCAVIRAEAEKQDVAISVHAPYFINLNASDEEWPKSRKRLMDAAHFGHLAGATDIIFHPGSYFGASPESVLETAIPRLRECVDELRSKDNPVILRPETMGKSAMLGSLTDTLQMSREIPGILPCLDFAHLHARPGDGTVNSYVEFSQIIHDYAKELGEPALKHLHIHLSGIEYTAKGEKNHLPIQESDLQIQELFKALREAHCAGRILCESPILEEDALFMQKIYPG